MEKQVKIVVAILIVGIILFLGYSQIDKWHRRTLSQALEKERAACSEQQTVLNEQIAIIEEELARINASAIPEKKISEIFGEKSDYLSYDTQVDCKAIAGQMKTFFNYLEKQPYMAEYKGKGGPQRLYRETVESLSSSPPMLSGEMEDLLSLIRNVTHLYRALGKNRIDVLKDICKNETDIIESVFAIFFIYALPEDRCQRKDIQVPTLEVLYQYSGYFLNTLAGRSYLLRRDSKIRVLMSYYSVLVLDRANDGMLNPFGIDIRPFIDVSFYEISSQRGLVYQRHYVAELERLREKYEM